MVTSSSRKKLFKRHQKRLRRPQSMLVAASLFFALKGFHSAPDAGKTSRRARRATGLHICNGANSARTDSTPDPKDITYVMNEYTPRKGLSNVNVGTASLDGGTASNNTPEKHGSGDILHGLPAVIEPLAPGGPLGQGFTSQEPSCDQSMAQILSETQGVLEVNRQPDDPDINQMLVDGQLFGPGPQGQDMSIDYNMFLDDFGLGGYIFADLGAEFPASVWSRPLLADEPERNSAHDQPLPARGSSQEAQNLFSRFGSRLPSLQPETTETSNDSRSQLIKDFTRAGARWSLTALDHSSLLRKLGEFSNVLPDNYSLPSRYTLSRYLEGFVGGFQDHFPIIHIPTASTNSCTPELLLAAAALGALYRFEKRKGNELFGFAKSIALEQVRRRNVQRGDAPSPGSTHRYNPSGVLLSGSDAAYSQVMGDKRTPVGNGQGEINIES
ncbi:unnamed protein product [Sphagnum balticum]